MVTNSPTGLIRLSEEPRLAMVSTRFSSSPSPRYSAAIPLGETWAVTSISRVSAFSRFLSMSSAIMVGHLQFLLK